MGKCLQLSDEAAMLAFGQALAEQLPAGLIIYLQGELGAGKTTLVRGILQALGHRGAVKSPTYTLVEPYIFENYTVYHFDLYRLGDPEELEYMGIRDYLDGQAVALIEWPDKGAGILPEADLLIRIEYREAGRQLTLEPHTPAGHALLKTLPA